MTSDRIVYISLALLVIVLYMILRKMAKRTEENLDSELSKLSDKALLQLIRDHKGSSFVNLYIEEAERRGLSVE